MLKKKETSNEEKKKTKEKGFGIKKKTGNPKYEQGIMKTF